MATKFDPTPFNGAKFTNISTIIPKLTLDMARMVRTAIACRLDGASDASEDETARVPVLLDNHNEQLRNNRLRNFSLGSLPSSAVSFVSLLPAPIDDEKKARSSMLVLVLLLVLVA